MKEYLNIIKNSALFSGMTDEEINTMCNCLDTKEARYKKGQYIMHIGDKADSLGLLIRGNAFIIQEDFWGNRNIIGKIIPAGLFAESFACSPESVMSVSVVAETECLVLWLAVNRILTTCPTTCTHHSRMIRNLLSELAAKNLKLNEKLTHMGQRTTREKVLSYLSAQVQKNNVCEFEIPFNRQQLADYLSVERSALSAELSKLRDEGIIQFDKNHFTVI